MFVFLFCVFSILSFFFFLGGGPLSFFGELKGNQKEDDPFEWFSQTCFLEDHTLLFRGRLKGFPQTWPSSSVGKEGNERTALMSHVVH